MKLVADENVDFGIIESLRKEGCEVIAIVEESPSIPDDEVLRLAQTHNALLITEDKDFGELVVRLKLRHQGVLLIRLSGLESLQKGVLVTKVLKQNYEKLIGNFSVLDEQQLRIRQLKN
jgi:predicted nuclease of predicted toxin-antitoxin system